MPEPESTRWTVVLKAAEGEASARSAFAARYEPVVRAYLGARWHGSAVIQEMDDAVQEVFLDCLRPEGALSRVDPEGPGGFRGFLFGVVRNVARRVEKRRARSPRQPDSRIDLGAIDAREDALSAVFDRAWASAILEQAGRLHEERSRGADERARRRVDLLRLRFQEDLPIREIARLWEAEPAHLHREYARARAEFKQALREVVEQHHPGSHREIEEECSRLAGFFR